MIQILRQTVQEFLSDECPRLAAALAYYAIFSLPALLVLVVAIAGMFADRQQVSGRLTEYMQQTMGETGAKQIETMLHEAGQPGRGLIGSLVGIVMLVIGATGVLMELQTALDRAWGVKPDPKQGGVRAFLMKRVLSLAMVLGIAFLLLVSLVMSWILSEFGSLIRGWAPDWFSQTALQIGHAVISLAIITVLFAALLKFLPDVELRWRDVWAGAIITSLLFVAGKFGLGLYLSYSDPTSAFGAAGSLALVLLWIYYSAMIFFFGAEFTQVLAARRGERLVPEPGAVVSAHKDSVTAAATPQA
jgi:membrane protein